MTYCENCHELVSGTLCPICGRKHLRPVTPEDFCFLTELEEMWCRMFTEILTDSGIPFAQLPSVGVGAFIRTGVPVKFRIYVPFQSLEDARALVRMAFPQN